LVDIFPPPGPDRRDSFFARIHTIQESNARLYLGVAAQGRSLKVILLRTYLALLGAAQKWYLANGGKRNKDNPADPYMTLLGYFNSLRELGGSRRIIEDEVRTRLSGYASRKREGETEGLFTERKIAYEVVELTSRVGTDKVAEAKRRLALPFHDDDHVDVAIATNMISVGLDITRLGLMVVLGQPKASAEYIQATSRVGRDPDRPGLVVTILNIHRPRDRSHYERFTFYHQSFYRSVEASSVTPFSPRALDRGLAGMLVALARQGHEPLTPPKGATEILRERGKLDFVVEALAARAAAYGETLQESQALRQRVRDRAVDLLDEWSHIAHELQNQGVLLQYQIETGGAQRLLYEFLNPDLKKLPLRHRKFRANRSMRDVEPGVNLWVKTLDNIDVEEYE
ncbi:MAG TPA: helicase-related protein, partial [Acidobacteriaceae bacterium]|nr:helicase-related protein [Acidobacteriaceae bacterium]